MHVTYLVDAHIAVLSHTKNPPSLYNIGTGHGTSVHEFVTICKEVTGVDINITNHEKSRPGDYAEVYANVDKIREEIGWEARYKDVKESLKHAWSWRLQHKEGY